MVRNLAASGNPGGRVLCVINPCASPAVTSDAKSYASLPPGIRFINIHNFLCSNNLQRGCLFCPLPRLPITHTNPTPGDLSVHDRHEWLSSRIGVPAQGIDAFQMAWLFTRIPKDVPKVWRGAQLSRASP